MPNIETFWFYEGQVRGINSVNSQLVYHRGGLRPRVATFMKKVRGNAVTSIITRDVVAVSIKCREGKDQKDVVVCSAHFLSDLVEMSPRAEFKELVEYCSKKKLELQIGSNANAHYTMIWGSSDVHPRGESLCEYLTA